MKRTSVQSNCTVAQSQSSRFNLAALLLSAIIIALAYATALTAQDGDPEFEGYGFGAGEPLPGKVNTEWAEMVPVLSSDGNSLYFDRKYAPMNIGGEDDPDDIYVSHRESDGTWGEPENVAALNTENSDVLYWISPSDDTAILYCGKLVDGREQGLSVATRRGDTWSEPVPMSIPGVETLGNYYYAHATPDGKHLFIAYAARGDEYNLDIFYTTAVDESLLKWEQPVPLQGLNTPFTEGSPWLAPDGRTLFFMSDRPTGMGLGDVFLARKRGDGWLNWSQPEDAGPPVNSPSYEVSVSLSSDGRYLYTSKIAFPGDTGKKGRTDIFRHAMPEQLVLLHSIAYKGTVTDAKSGAPIQAEIRARTTRTDEILAVTRSNAAGEFEVTLGSGAMISFSAHADGYRDEAVVFDARYLDATMEIPEVVIEMNKGQTSRRDTIPIVRFSVGSSSVSQDYVRALDRFADEVKLTRDRLVLTGHTDNVGDPEENRELSLQRARAVREILMGAGIPSDRIDVRGAGESSPLRGNGTAAGRAANRRVEIQRISS